MYKPESIIIAILLEFIYFCLHPISKADIVSLVPFILSPLMFWSQEQHTKI